MSTSVPAWQPNPRKPALGESSTHNRGQPTSAPSPLTGGLGIKQRQKASLAASPTKRRLRRVGPLGGSGSGGVLRLAQSSPKQPTGQPSASQAGTITTPALSSSPFSSGVSRPTPSPAPPSPPAPKANALLRPVRSQPSLRPPPRRQVSDQPPLRSKVNESEGERKRRMIMRGLPQSPSFPPASASASTSASAGAAVAGGMSGRPPVDGPAAALLSVEDNIKAGRPSCNTLPHPSAHPNAFQSAYAAAATPIAPRVLFRKELFLFQHEREFPHLHRRGASTTAASLQANSETGTVAEAASSTASRSTPLLSPPPSPPVIILPLASAGHPALSQPPTSANEAPSAVRGIFLSFTGASGDKLSASENGSCNSCGGPSRRVDYDGQISTGGAEAVSLSGRSSADMSSEADLDFAFDPPVSSPSRTSGPVVVAVRSGPERSAALTTMATSNRTSFAVEPKTTTTRVWSPVAGMSSSIGSSRSSSPANGNFFDVSETEPSPNPSSLYTTPEHASEPRFGPLTAHPSPTAAVHGLTSKAGQDDKSHGLPRAIAPPGLVRVRTNNHRRGPSSISYRFSPPAASCSDRPSTKHAPVANGNRPTLPGSTSASTVDSSEAHRRAWRLSNVDIKDIERELFWRPPSPERQNSSAGLQTTLESPTDASFGWSDALTPPPMAVTFGRPTSTTPADASWPRRPSYDDEIAHTRDAPRPPPAFAPVLLSRAALDPTRRARLDGPWRSPPRLATRNNVAIVVQPSTPRATTPDEADPLMARTSTISADTAALRLPSTHRPRRTVSIASTSSSTVAGRSSSLTHSAGSSSSISIERPADLSQTGGGHHLRNRSSISRRARMRAGPRASEGSLATALATAVRMSVTERVERALRAPLGLLEDVLPAQMVFWLGFVLGPWCFVLGGWGLASDGSFILTRLQGARVADPRSLNASARRRAQCPSPAHTHGSNGFWGPPTGPRQSSFDSARSGFFWPFRSTTVLPAVVSDSDGAHKRFLGQAPEPTGGRRIRAHAQQQPLQQVRRKQWVLPALRHDAPNKWVFRNRVAAILSGLVVLPMLVISVIFAIL